MKKNLSIYLLMVSLILSLAFPAFAASDVVQAKSWKITMRGHVLCNRGDSLAVYLKSPQNMETQTDLAAYPIINLPITENSIATESNGTALKLSGLLPGQEVKVTFRYYIEKTETEWRSIPDGETGVDVSYSYEATECLNIALIGETIKLKSRTTLSELKDDTMLGTIMTVNGNKLEVYVEGGRILYQTSGTEFMPRGTEDVEIANDTKLLDAKGNSIKQSAIKPFQRVLLKAADHDWYDGSYGYAGSNKYPSIQIVNAGEKMFSISEIQNFNKMTGTVIKQQKNSEGNIQLVIQPDEGSRERQMQEQYIITQVGQPPVLLQSFAVGARVTFDYEGLNYASSPGRIGEYYNIKTAN